MTGAGARPCRDGNHGSHSGCGQISRRLCFPSDIVRSTAYALRRSHLCKFSALTAGLAREEEDEDDDEEEEGEEESEGALCGIACRDFAVRFRFFAQCRRVSSRAVKRCQCVCALEGFSIVRQCLEE